MQALPIQRIRLSVPDGWADVSLLSVVAPDGKDFRANILVTHEPWTGSIEAYARSQVEQTRREMKKYEQHALRPAKAGNLDAMLLEHSFVGDEGPARLRQIQIFVSTSGVVYTVAMTDRDQAFEAQRATFDRIVGSLAID